VELELEKKKQRLGHEVTFYFASVMPSATKSRTANPEMNEDIETLVLLGQHLISSILHNEPVQVIKSIIDSGAPLWFQSDNDGMSALHAAAYTNNEELVKLLISEGAIWNAGRWIVP
jgi:protein arginine N-methyltransferase 2